MSFQVARHEPDDDDAEAADDAGRMTIRISQRAEVSPRAGIGRGVRIGPYCVVGPDVTIGDGTRLESNVTITGRVTIGRHNRIFPGAVIGAEPQDLSYRGGDTQVVIGDHNVLRESVTVNRATQKEDGVTSIDSHCYFMSCSHVAHDCRIGSHVVVANNTLIGGHVRIADHASLSGGVGVHHFVTIGSYSFVGGLSRVQQDLPPFLLAEGIPARPRCVNVVALKRADFSADVINCLAQAHKLIYRAKVGLDHARELLRAKGILIPQVTEMLAFIQEQQEGRHGRSRERRRAA